MGKYGKKNVINKSIIGYNCAILGLSGIGKTTLMVNVCEKLVGEDGYIIFNTGKEDGISCIDGAIYENIETWKKFDEVTKDIIKNKQTDYPELKIVVIDTIDQLFEIAEPEVIRMYNNEKLSKSGSFKSATTINEAYGYGKGLDKVIEIVLNKIWALKKVGIAVWMCGHTKTKELVDPLTDQTYTTISANLSQKYFNAIKTKMHILGMAVIDRDIITESTGRKDIHNKDIEKSKVVREARKIIFRDDNYGVDSKSRFAGIVEEIPLDADAFIEAVQDAIKKAEKREKNHFTPIIKSTPPTPVLEPEEELEEEPVDIPEDEEEQPLVEEDILEEELPNEDEEIPLEELRKSAKTAYTSCTDKALKSEIRSLITSYGKLTDVDREGLNKIIAMAG